MSFRGKNMSAVCINMARVFNYYNGIRKTSMWSVWKTEVIFVKIRQKSCEEIRC